MLLVLVGLVAGPAVPGFAEANHTTIVSENPADNTPRVADGEVDAIVQIGDTVVVGGTFSGYYSAGTSVLVSQPKLFAFDVNTGRGISAFAPTVDGQVNALVAAADGQSVYAGGAFTNVNGVRSKSLVRLNLADGKFVAGFKSPGLNGIVTDLQLSGGRLFLGGTFSTAYTAATGTITRPSLLAIDPATGVLDNSVDLGFAGPRSTTNPTTGATITAPLGVEKFDVSTDGNRLVAIGNFSAVSGQPRHQVAVIDLSTSPASLADWSTDRYLPDCKYVFPSYVRDVGVSPDNSYFVIVTTGAYMGGAGANVLCDTAARFETYAPGSGQQPTWVNYTGGDTLTAVQVTEAAVYLGGHPRWLNNPFAGDKAGPGAVSREGIGAVDPVSGIPFTWNPTRTRGVGVFDFFATPDGLWIGSDTNEFGGEYHPKLAFVPLAGGTSVPVTPPGRLPNDVYLLGKSGTTSTDVVRRYFDGTAATTNTTLPPTGVAWNNVRGAVMLGDRLYTGWSDGTFRRRSFDGATFGPDSTVNLYLGSFANDLPNVTGMFFDSGRLYFTVANVAKLYYRGFTTESDIVGAQKLEVPAAVTGLDWATASGMFLSGGNLYVASSKDGNLRKVAFSDGRPSGPVSVVSGPTVDGKDWRPRGLFVGTGEPVNDAPTASFTSNCSQRTCTVDGSTSSDPDGSIASYAWDFGDGATGTGATASHSYANDGTYTVTLTVTDDRGRTGTTSSSMTVGDPGPTASFTASCTDLTCAVDAGGSSDAGGQIVSYAWDFGDSSSGSGVTASHTYATAGPYVISLTVTDDAGQTATATQGVTVTDLPPNAAPTASFTAQCTDLACDVDGSGSTDSDGTIATYAWNFGDGTTASGATTRHVYASAGTYTITLTVTDDRGGTGTTTREVTVTDPPNQDPTASFTSACTNLGCSFDASASSDPEGRIAAYDWNFGDTATGSGQTAAHTYAAAGTYTVTLTVRDADGGVGTATKDVTVTAPVASSIAFRAAVGANRNATSHPLVVPSTVRAGDGLLLFASDASGTVTITGPTGVTGWTPAGTLVNGQLRTQVWKKVAATGDAGKTLTLKSATTVKMGMSLLAYSGTSTADPVAIIASAKETVSRTTHTTPTVTGVTAGSWGVSYWADRTSATTAWTTPTGQTLRNKTFGSGGGRITTLATDKGSALAAGSYGGIAATANSATSAATMWTVILRPAG